MLQRTESQVLLHSARKQVRALVHQTELSAQRTRRDLPVVFSFHVNCPAGGFIEPVQQSEQRTFSRATGTNDGQNFSATNLEGDVFDQNFIFYRAAQVFGSQDGIGNGAGDHGNRLAASEVSPLGSGPRRAVPPQSRGLRCALLPVY